MGRTFRNLLLSCFCCHSLPSFPWITTSSCTKLAYLTLFFTCLILLWIAVEIPVATRNLPFCKGDDSLLCRHYSNFPATYRICFTYALFFTVMCACTFGISSSRSYRSVIHNGFWFLKILFIIGLLIGTAFIPHGLFDKIFMYFGLMFVLTFNVFEMFMYTQLIKYLSFICRNYCFRQSSACTKFFATFFALILLGAGVGIFIILYTAYSKCTINFVFTILNMSLSYLINLGSFFIKLHKRDWNSILAGSILTTHVMFITWSAITNNPRDECNPSREFANTFFAITNFTSLSVTGLTIVLAVEYFIQSGAKEKPNAVTYVEERGKECCGIWGKRKLVQITEPENSTDPPEGIIYKSTDPDENDEYDHVKYFWYAMHNLFLQAIFYFMICFTSNYVYNKTPREQIFYNEAAMWFKIVSSWLCMLSFAIIEFLPDSTRVYAGEQH